MIESTSRTESSDRPHWLMIAAPLAIMAVIFVLSSRSHLPDLDGGRDVQSVLGHFTVYAALGAALTLLFRSCGWQVGRALLAAVILATIYGATDELHQSFVPNRTPDSADLLIDFLGATVGSMAILTLQEWRASTVSASSDAVPDRPADESS